ncbi:MAG: hypothetical protein EA364_10980 [Balneolaceae bacterium]|nr:MAG: hypothetical protein EA364_10980 [Balneolaceae bacterium]
MYHLLVPLIPALLSALLFLPAAVQAQHIPAASGTRIVVISDFNSSYGSVDYPWHVDSVIARIPAWNADLVLSAGDLIAGQRLSLTDENMQQMWDAFSDRILLPLTRNGVPFGFTLGNHDASSFPAYDRDRRFARDFWLDPAHDPLLDFHDRSHYPFYFSFVHSDLFLVSWYASSSVIDNEQKNWLRQQLGSQQARDASMRVLIGHLPVHAVAEGRNRRGENLDNPDELMQLLDELGIDLYVCGHHHAYYPARKNGIRFIHAGAIGDGPRPLIGSTLPPRKAFTIVDLVRNNEAGDATHGSADHIHKTGVVTHAAGVYTHGGGDHTHGISDFTSGTGDHTHGADDFTNGTGDYIHRAGDFTNGTGDYIHRAGDVTSGTGPYHIRRTSYNPDDWSLINEDELPRYIRGVNGYITRDGLHPLPEYSGVLSAFHTPGVLPDALTGETDYSATFENGNLHIQVNYSDFRSAVTGISLRMGTPAENGRILARTTIPAGVSWPAGDVGRPAGSDLPAAHRQSGTLELTHTLQTFDAEALAAGLLYIALETVGSPGGAARAHLYPPHWTCDAKGYGRQGVPGIEHTESGYHLAWTRAHPLTAEPVFYSVDVAADSAFSSLPGRIPAGTGLQQTINEKTLKRLAARAGVQPEQLYIRITATDGAVHCTSPVFQLNNQ